jgi:hypothetical protein
MQLVVLVALLSYWPLKSYFKGLFLSKTQGENMGFLSAYEGTNKVVVDEERGYWVELAKHVSQGEKEEAERSLSKIVMVNGEATPTPDVARWKQLMLAASIKEWNLDDDNGAVWPIDLKHVQMLPSDIFDELWKVVTTANKEKTPQEERQFPAESVGGGADGDAGAPELFDVPTA